MTDRRPHSVVALAYDGLCTFEFGIVVEVFGLRRPELSVPWYRFAVCSLERHNLRAAGGVMVRAAAGLGRLRHADTIIIPGWRDADEKPPETLTRAIRRAHERAARLVSICSGVFVLAEAGLLDDRHATTHWRYSERLSARFPRIRVEPDVLYTDEGNILTSAGSAAGIDLCLHIVRRDYGAAIANQVARRLVVQPHREGGQSQYVPQSLRLDNSHSLATLLDRVQGSLHRSWTISDLAKLAAMSDRTFARHFREETGTSPYRWLTHVRLLSAQHRLETTNQSVDEIARAVGFGTAETLRHHFRRRFHVSPTSHRRRFSTRGDRPRQQHTRLE
jgi:AraC family transcriptional activator FtrA